MVHCSIFTKIKSSCCLFTAVTWTENLDFLHSQWVVLAVYPTFWPLCHSVCRHSLTTMLFATLGSHVPWDALQNIKGRNRHWNQGGQGGRASPHCPTSMLLGCPGRTISQEQSHAHPMRAYLSVVLICMVVIWQVSDFCISCTLVSKLGRTVFSLIHFSLFILSWN